jgi:hypothetical protein
MAIYTGVLAADKTGLGGKRKERASLS